MGNYKLINPVMAGKISTSFNQGTPAEAAQDFWNSLDGKVVNELFKFAFTLQDDAGKMYHFSVVEHKEGGNVKYAITDVTDEVNKNANPEDLKQLQEESNKVQEQIAESKQEGGKKKRKSKKQKGGKDSDSDDKEKEKRKRHKKYSSSSSSSSDDNGKIDISTMLRQRMYLNTPISYFWYSPLIYKIRNIFTPVFVQPIAPYVQLWLPMR